MFINFLLVLDIVMLAKFAQIYFVYLLQLSNRSQCIHIWTQFVGSYKYLSSCYLEADGKWWFAWPRVSCGKTNTDRVCLLCFLPLFFIFYPPFQGCQSQEPGPFWNQLLSTVDWDNSMFRRIMYLTLGRKGDQNMTPQNIPLWNKNYFNGR